MAIFKGAGVAIVTPMYEDGKVNYDKLEELLEFQIANSTDAIIICGTTGESSTMTHGEHLKTIKFAIDKVNKRVPVIAGTGSNCTETAIMMSKEAASYGADALLDYCTERNLPVVLCTTGLSEEQLAKVEETAKKIPVLKSANMSLGINTLMKLIQEAAKVLATAGFDMEIVEKHHHLKLDAPSGTALALADSLNEAMDNQYHYVYDRSQKREMRDEKEIGISAVRGGTIVGEHEVIFAGEDEVIEFKHTAYSKAIFGKGAIEAAKFLAGKPAGKYDMADVIEG